MTVWILNSTNHFQQLWRNVLFLAHFSLHKRVRVLCLLCDYNDNNGWLLVQGWRRRRRGLRRQRRRRLLWTSTTLTTTMYQLLCNFWRRCRWSAAFVSTVCYVPSLQWLQTETAFQLLPMTTTPTIEYYVGYVRELIIC